MNIALFADIHGRILLCFKLCARWEKESGEKIDLILQAGDLGAFPDESLLDKATLRFARKDSTELGFLNDFLHPRKEVAAVLEETRCTMVFVRGNHEDHRWLDSLEQKSNSPIYPIDAYQRVFCLKTGVPYRFEKNGQALEILGIGRIAHQDSSQDYHLQPYESQKLKRLGRSQPNILLTHDSATDAIYSGSGMDEIRAVLDRYKPSYHFFGHYGGSCQQGLDANRKTWACKLADLHWDERKLLEKGSMAILRWRDKEEHRLEIVDEPWLKEYGAYSWREHGL